MRLYPELEAALIAWIERQPEPKPSRSEALRRFGGEGLGFRGNVAGGHGVSPVESGTRTIKIADVTTFSAEACVNSIISGEIAAG